ncbi:hypothetical protein EYZ11_012160 [Aspergillus tanneri]|uniref:Uncharacterized protein n=1 Tax=Aspergillus tanneri TaxID=1220188 RepID=A0A4S3J1J1_9EURO|nr:hypothetical protein EYZ11_012160 [Aspergillus tanneri]
MSALPALAAYYNRGKPPITQLAREFRVSYG